MGKIGGSSLSRSESEREDAVFEAANFAFIAMSADGFITGWNPKAQELFGWSREEVLGQRLSETVIPPQLRPAHEKGLRSHRVTGDGPVLNRLLEVGALHRDGHEFPAEISIWPTTDEGGVLTFNAVLHDISERRQTENRLRANEQRLAEAQLVAHLGSWDWDPESDQITWSDELYRLFGIDPDAFEPTFDGYLDRLHPEDRERAAGVIGRALETDSEFSFDHRVVRPDNSIGWIHCRGQVEMNADGAPFRMHGTAADITERVRLQEELVALALVDELTGLHNRRGFLTLADHQRKVAARSGRGLPLLFVDVDGMKTINDTFGHGAGDQALIDVAAFLRGSCRASDLVARVGGDEFCIMLIDDSLGGGDMAMPDVDRLVGVIRQGPPEGRRIHPLTLSVGVARLMPGAETVADLMDRADVAMYEDKASSRRKPRLLVVEDNAALRRLAELSLRHRYEVVTAATGLAAKQYTAERLPDVVLLDLGLPDMTGIDVLRALRALPGGDRVPVIMITAAAGRDAELESRREGVDDFATKPLDLELLEARIDNVLQRSLVRPRRLSG